MISIYPRKRSAKYGEAWKTSGIAAIFRKQGSLKNGLIL